MSTSTWSLRQVAEPAKKKQADSIKQPNEAHQVRAYNPALDKQHERPLVVPAVPHLGKRPKKRKFAKEYPCKYFS